MQNKKGLLVGWRSSSSSDRFGVTATPTCPRKTRHDMTRHRTTRDETRDTTKHARNDAADRQTPRQANWRMKAGQENGDGRRSTQESGKNNLSPDSSPNRFFRRKNNDPKFHHTVFCFCTKKKGTPPESSPHHSAELLPAGSARKKNKTFPSDAFPKICHL